MRDGPAEPFGSWFAKRATVAVILFVLWSWFVSSPATFSGAIETTGRAWCAAFPCATDTNTDDGDGEGLTFESGITGTGDAAVDIVFDLHDAVETAVHGPTDQVVEP
ncbi:MAG: hypothetical protein AAF467_27325 [Actinomycetota bacterium]